MRICVFVSLDEVRTNSFFQGATAASRPGLPHYPGFTIALRHTTLCKTPLDEWSARRNYPCLITHNTQADRYPCLRRDSNPQSQPASGRRPMTQTA